MSYILTDEQVSMIMKTLYIRSEQLKHIETKEAKQEQIKLEVLFAEFVYQQKH